MAMDAGDRAILEVMQTGVPLERRPFEAIGRAAGMSEAEVMARVRRMKGEEGGPAMIRQVSAIFDSRSLGYQSTLVAAEVPAEKLDAAVAVVNGHPGVSHNYERTHRFNLWYTLAVPGDSALGLEGTLAILHEQSGAVSTRMLPTVKLYKIGVKFDLSGEGDLASRGEARGYTQAQRDAAGVQVLSAREKRFVRVLQQDLPIEAEAFEAWAEQAGVSVDELLAAAKEFESRGLMRRFAAVLKHREAGISANAMGVWAVEPGKEDAFGEAAAGFSAVSHCYLRRRYADWPYSVFTMVHAPTAPQCEQVLAAISEATGVREYAALYSTREFKKVRVKYFVDDVYAWEARMKKAGT